VGVAELEVPHPLSVFRRGGGSNRNVIWAAVNLKKFSIASKGNFSKMLQKNLQYFVGGWKTTLKFIDIEFFN
jgi:hypothetical protein